MSHQATVELLSRYLDGQLAGAERTRVEELIAADGEARRIYEGLGQVRGSLQQLANAAPPFHLAALVERRVALAAEESGLWHRVGRLRGWLFDSPVLPSLAVVLALGGMLYTLAYGLERLERGREPIILSAPPGVVEPELIAVARRTLRREESRWVESRLGSSEVGSAPRFEFSAAETSAWLARHPELVELRALGAVVLELDGEVVELVFAADGD